MEKLLLPSILVALVVLPLRAARADDARAGLRRALKQVLLFNTVYWLAVVYLYFYVGMGRDGSAILHRSVGG